MNGPTPRQLLYALVAAGFLLITVVLTAGAAAAGVVPLWWTVAMALLLAVAVLWGIAHWRRTAQVLAVSIVVLVVWAAGTLLMTR